MTETVPGLKYYLKGVIVLLLRLRSLNNLKFTEILYIKSINIYVKSLSMIPLF